MPALRRRPGPEAARRRVLEHLLRQLFPGAASIAETEGCKSGVVDNRQWLAVGNSEHSPEPAVGQARLPAVRDVKTRELKCKFGSRNRRERGRATTNAGPWAPHSLYVRAEKRRNQAVLETRGFVRVNWRIGDGISTGAKVLAGADHLYDAHDAGCFRHKPTHQLPASPALKRRGASDGDGTIGILGGDGWREEIGDWTARSVDLEIEEARADARRSCRRGFPSGMRVSSKCASAAES